MKTAAVMPTMELGPGQPLTQEDVYKPVSFPCFPNSPEDAELLLQFNDKRTRAVSILFENPENEARHSLRGRHGSRMQEACRDGRHAVGPCPDPAWPPLAT